MAQCGLHVPASHAEMNVFDAVFADIGDEQSLQQSLSTFSGHVSNIVRILNSLQPNSLVLLDEVGAGTDPGEGAALARAILEHLRRQNARVIATSHYGELKTYAFTTDGVQNASVEFDDSTLAPTYRLLQGIPGSSNAFAIAGRLGLGPEILDAARRSLTGSDETADLLRELEENRRQAIADARETERARVEAQMLRRRYEEELTALETLRREARQKAEEEARTAIRRAQDRFDHILTEVRRAGSEGRQTERARQAIQDIGRDLQSAIRRRNEDEQAQRLMASAPDRPLRRGDRVRITSLGTIGELLEDPHENGPLPVQVGAMRVSVPAASLRLLGEESNPPRTLPQPMPTRRDREDAETETGRSLSKAVTITPQLTLLGQRADEAVQNVEKYLDDAYAAGLTRTRLVHGKGTGALRRAVQQYLDGHPLVSDYATADPEEGGAGATVVTLKPT
jgi:DNA mismatch repair protein MutS2